MDPGGIRGWLHFAEPNQSFLLWWSKLANPTIVALVFFVAGMLKLTSLNTFERSVTSWELIPTWAIAPITLSLPPIELGLGLAWCLSVRRSILEVMMIALLLLFSSVYIIHLVFAIQPDCGCLGEIRLFEKQQNQARFVLGRNGVLLALLLPATIMRAFGGARR